MISVDWTLGLQFLNFVILLLVLNMMLYKPLKKVMQERRQTIDGSHDKARQLEVEIEEKMARYQQQLAEARSAANDERNQLKKLAAEEERTILGDAHSKATARLQTIKQQVAEEAAKAESTLKDQADSLAGQIATRVLGRELN